MISFSIQNFGCRVNQAEAFSWAEDLQLHGLKLEEDAARSELVFVNTCTLTSRADRDARKYLRKISRLNPKARLIITGCGISNGGEMFRTLPQAWLISPNEEKERLVETVLSRVVTSEEGLSLPFRSRALLKVQDGCNQGCTFCIIPRVRGKSASCPEEKVLSRAERLIRKGYHEIVLCGIHLSSYGYDLKPRSSLLELLQKILILDGLGKVRLSSLDPRLLDAEFLSLLTSKNKVCPHFHLSLQHASPRILKLMGRGGSFPHAKRALTFLRDHSPNASLGADIIVGFPAEGEEDFRVTYDFLATSPLTYFHVFSYSPRPGTPAAGMAQVDGRVKGERSSLLRKLSSDKKRAFRKSFLGKELEGVVVKGNGRGVKVLTANYLDVSVRNCGRGLGEEVRVRITEVNERQMIGCLTD